MRATRALLLSIAWLASVPAESSADPIGRGAGSFRFAEPGQPDLKVWTYRPKRHGPADPVLVVMHGTKRNGRTYRDAWVDHAEKIGVLLLVPEFTKSDYPPGWGYQQIGAVDSEGDRRPKRDWAPQRIEALFEHVVRELELDASTYYFYGHSAGGQFVHRTMLLMPEARVELALPANPGWYTLPRLDTPYPEGLASTPVAAESLAASFSREVVLLLGEEDSDADHKYLPREEAAVRQGPHRFARGMYFYGELARSAEATHSPLNWRVRTAPGVGHSNSEMAPHAAEVIAEHLRKKRLANRQAAAFSAPEPTGVD